MPKKHKGSQVATTATTATTTTAATTMLRVHPSGSVSVYYVLTNISLYYEANVEHLTWRILLATHGRSNQKSSVSGFFKQNHFRHISY